jgi:hypothetical protein
VHSALNHFATPGFWFHYRQLPPDIRELADKNFALLRNDPRHPSLRFKKIGQFWSARVGPDIVRLQENARTLSSGSGLGLMTNMSNCSHRDRGAP